MPRNEHCVYEAANVDQADVVAAWLAEHGIETILPDRHTTSTLGLPNLIPSSIEVCVAHAEQLEVAQALITDHEQALAEHLAASAPSGSIAVTCGSCAKDFEVEAREAGHVVDCPHCQEYVDVPDPMATDDMFAEEDMSDEDEEE